MGPPRLPLLLLGCLAPLLLPPGAAEFSPSLDSDFTFTLPAGRKECFYQPMRKEASLELEYQVGRAGPRGARDSGAPFRGCSVRLEPLTSFRRPPARGLRAVAGLRGCVGSGPFGRLFAPGCRPEPAAAPGEGEAYSAPSFLSYVNRLLCVHYQVLSCHSLKRDVGCRDLA